MKLVQLGIALNERNQRERTPLIVAALRKHTDMVVALFGSGADLNAKDDLGCAAIHWAARDDIKTVKALIALGADLYKPSEEWGSPLHIAAMGGDIEVVRTLLKHRGNIDQIDHDNTRVWGCTPLHLAAENGHTEIVRFLIGQGAMVDKNDGFGLSALHFAARAGQTETAMALVERGVHVNARTNVRKTPLHFAAYNGFTKTVLALISLGGDVNATDKYGGTPLHEAASDEKLETALMLIRNGANVSKRNKDGYSPLGLAKELGHPRLAAELRKHDPCSIQ